VERRCVGDQKGWKLTVIDDLGLGVVTGCRVGGCAMGSGSMVIVDAVLLGNEQWWL
jgi:hypothetical protein